MSELEGQLSSQPALSIFRQLGMERHTGVLELHDDESGKADRFFFVSGELYLAPDHPLALAVGGSGASEPSAAESVEGLGALWFTQATFRLQGWTDGSFRFSENLREIPSDLIGPLPTFSIIMAGAVSDLDEFQLLKVLGGEESRFAVTPASLAPPPELIQLDPHEAFFLSRMVQPVSVKELVVQSDLDRTQGLQRLCRLLAAGLICREDELPQVRPGTLLSPEILEKFSRRIVGSLERQPFELDPGEHRRQIANLLGGLGGMNYYELLGIGVGATSEEIHEAYSDLARVVHPSHAEALGLQGKEGGMQLLLEKVTEAYLTLNDRDRSRRYLQEIGSTRELHGMPSAESRRDEVERMAEENYKRAVAMAQREDYHFAVELLFQAVRALPKAKYYVLLGRCQAQNPQWLQKSLASYGRALQLDSENVEIRLELARVLEATGDVARARREYSEVLRRQPSSPEASTGLSRLETGRKAAGTESKWLDRILRRLRG